MVWFIFAIIFITAGAIFGIGFWQFRDVEYAKHYPDDKEGIYPMRKYSKLAWIAGGTLFVLFIAFACTTSVSTEHTGIVTTFGKMENYTLDSGIHFKFPWNKVYEMDNRVQKATIELACFSSDIQEVDCKYTINYRISSNDAAEVYRTIGKDYFEVVITPAVSESVKTIIARYTAENLVSNRDTLTVEIETLLKESLAAYNIQVATTAIEDLDFTDEFTNAVEAKQVAVQNKLRATTEQEQKTMEANQQAERTKIEAEAQAEVAKIQANADLEVQKINADAAEYAGQKEAAKNKAINESLTPDLLTYYQILQWDGKYPETYMGDNVNALIGIGN